MYGVVRATSPVELRVKPCIQLLTERTPVRTCVVVSLMWNNGSLRCERGSSSMQDVESTWVLYSLSCSFSFELETNFDSYYHQFTEIPSSTPDCGCIGRDTLSFHEESPDWTQSRDCRLFPRFKRLLRMEMNGNMGNKPTHRSTGSTSLISGVMDNSSCENISTEAETAYELMFDKIPGLSRWRRILIFFGLCFGLLLSSLWWTPRLWPQQFTPFRSISIRSRALSGLFWVINSRIWALQGYLPVSATLSDSGPRWFSLLFSPSAFRWGQKCQSSHIVPHLARGSMARGCMH